MKINFSILGSGYIVKLFDKNSLVYQKTKALNTVEIQELLYNNEKFIQLKLYNSYDAIASTFYELRPDKQFVIYNLDRISRLEIKMKNQKRIKLFFKNIIVEELLFPFYNFNNVFSPFSVEEGLIILENDIGGFGKCVIESEIFDIELLCFDVFKIDSYNKQFISKILYDNQELLFTKRDSLFNGKVFIIHGQSVL